MLALVFVGAVAIFAESVPWGTVATYALWLSFAPLAIRGIRLLWEESYAQLLSCRGISFRSNCKKRLGGWEAKIFLPTRGSLLTAFATAALGIASVAPQPTMFGSAALDAVGLALFAVVLFQAGDLAFMVGAASVCLLKTRTVVARADSGALESGGMRRFEAYWLTLPAASFGVYVAVYFATRATPYGLGFPFHLWLIGTASVPAVAVGAYFLGILRLRQHVKFMRLEEISKEIRRQSRPGGDWGRMVTLTEMIRQESHAREWPVSASVVNAFLLGAVPLASAILTVYLQVSKSGGS